MEQGNIILSEFIQVQKIRRHIFLLIFLIETQYKHRQYYEKQVTLRGSHIKEGEGKRRKLRSEYG
jgi:hypothetical protein